MSTVPDQQPAGQQAGAEPTSAPDPSPPLVDSPTTTPDDSPATTEELREPIPHVTRRLWTAAVRSMSQQIADPTGVGAKSGVGSLASTQQATRRSGVTPPTIDLPDDLAPPHQPDFDDDPDSEPFVPPEPFDHDQLGQVVPGRGGVPSGLQPNAAQGAAAARQLLNFDGVIGGIGQRSYKSDHAHGNAIDLMTHSNVAQGWEMARWFHENRDALGVKYIIFNGKIASSRDDWAWRSYSHPTGRTDATAMHHDHVHISFHGGQRATGNLSGAGEERPQPSPTPSPGQARPQPEPAPLP